MSILRVTSVSGNPDVRAALNNASTFTLECTGEHGSKAEVCLSLVEQVAVVRETSDGQKWEERCLGLAEEAQIRYGVHSAQCGDTPELPLAEALRLLTADPAIFKVIFKVIFKGEDDLHNRVVYLTLREYGTTWVLYGFAPKGGDYFKVIPAMPTEEEVGRLD